MLHSHQNICKYPKFFCTLFNACLHKQNTTTQGKSKLCVLTSKEHLSANIGPISHFYLIPIQKSKTKIYSKMKSSAKMFQKSTKTAINPRIYTLFFDSRIIFF